MDRLIKVIIASVILTVSVSSIAQEDTTSDEVSDSMLLEKNNSDQVKIRVFWRDFPGKKKDRPKNQEYRFPDGMNLQQALMVITSTERARGNLKDRDDIDWSRVRLGSTELHKRYESVVNNVASELEKHSNNLTLLERQRREFNRLAVRLSERDSMASYFFGQSYPLSAEADRALAVDNGVYILVLPYEGKKPKHTNFDVHESVSDKHYDWYVTETGQLVKTEEGDMAPVTCFDIAPVSEVLSSPLNEAECRNELAKMDYVYFDGLALDEDSESLISINEQLLALLAHGRSFH